MLRNCKSQHYDGGAAGLFAGTSEFVMNGTARMENNEADYGGGVYIGQYTGLLHHERRHHRQ